KQPFFALFTIFALALPQYAVAQESVPATQEPAEETVETDSDTDASEIVEEQPRSAVEPTPVSKELPAFGVPNTPPQSASTTTDEPGKISLQEWENDDWMLLTPRTSLLELHGYFRMRGDMLRKLDFGNNTQ